MLDENEKVTSRPSIHFYCPPALQQRLKIAAKHQKRSLSNFLVIELETAVERIEAEMHATQGTAPAGGISAKHVARKISPLEDSDFSRPGERAPALPKRPRKPKAA